MTKEEILEALKEGKRVRHYSFSSKVSMILENNYYIFNNGIYMTPYAFWRDKNNECWNIGWEIIN